MGMLDCADWSACRAGNTAAKSKQANFFFKKKNENDSTPLPVFFLQRFSGLEFLVQMTGRESL